MKKEPYPREKAKTDEGTWGHHHKVTTAATDGWTSGNLKHTHVYTNERHTHTMFTSGEEMPSFREFYSEAYGTHASPEDIEKEKQEKKDRQ